MKPGAIVRMTNFRHHFAAAAAGEPGLISTDHKAPRGQVFALLLLGIEPKAGPELDATEILKGWGWTPPPDAQDPPELPAPTEVRDHA